MTPTSMIMFWSLYHENPVTRSVYREILCKRLDYAVNISPKLVDKTGKRKHEATNDNT